MEIPARVIQPLGNNRVTMAAGNNHREITREITPEKSNVILLINILVSILLQLSKSHKQIYV